MRGSLEVWMYLEGERASADERRAAERIRAAGHRLIVVPRGDHRRDASPPSCDMAYAVKADATIPDSMDGYPRLFLKRQA